MKWTRTSSKPITTEREVEVTNGHQVGRTTIIWKHLRVRFSQFVYSVDGRICLDDRATYVESLMEIESNT